MVCTNILTVGSSRAVVALNDILAISSFIIPKVTNGGSTPTSGGPFPDMTPESCWGEYSVTISKIS